MTRKLSTSGSRWFTWALALALILTFSTTVLAQEGVQVEHTAAYWQATYWNNITLSGPPVLRQREAQIDYDWGYGAPHPSVNADHFSVRWTRYIDVEPGTYRFRATVDDGIRVWIDGDLLIDQWRDQSRRTYTASRHLSAGHHQVRVEYYENWQTASVEVSWSRQPDDSFQHWRGEYYDNKTLSGQPKLVRDDRVLNFYWGTGSPAPGRISPDCFSVRWTRDLVLPEGNHRFAMTVDDGGRLYVNGHLLIDAWRDQSRRTYYGDIYLPGGSVRVQMEYYENTGVAQATLAMDKPSPGEWRTFTSRTFRIDLKYPAHWQQVTEEKFAGPDGFFRVDALDGESIGHVARAEAYHVLRPYGSRPTIEALLIDSHDARLILPSADQPAGMDDQAALIIRYPRPVACGMQTCRFVGLYADKGHIRAIGETLRFHPSAPPNPDPFETVIVDDTDRNFSKHGTASYWRTAREGHGGSLTWTRNNDRRRTGYNWARWRPELAAAHYEVFVYVPERYSTTAKARYWISHRGGYTLRVLDQSANGGRWVSLGSYMFRGDSSDHVSLSDVTYEPYVSRLIAFDAVKWVRLP